MIVDLVKALRRVHGSPPALPHSHPSTPPPSPPAPPPPPPDQPPDELAAEAPPRIVAQSDASLQRDAAAGAGPALGRQGNDRTDDGHGVALDREGGQAVRDD